MDSLHPEMKVKRIVWKSSSKERLANEVNDDHDSSSRISQDDAKKTAAVLIVRMLLQCQRLVILMDLKIMMHR